MLSRASLLALVFVFNACAPFAGGEAPTEDEPKPAATEEPVVTETPATEPAPDAGSDDGGADADTPPPVAKDDCRLIECLFH